MTWCGAVWCDVTWCGVLDGVSWGGVRWGGMGCDEMGWEESSNPTVEGVLNDPRHAEGLSAGVISGIAARVHSDLSRACTTWVMAGANHG